MPLDCQTTFTSNGSVAAFGGVARGSLNADGDDFAGLGVRHFSWPLDLARVSTDM